MMNIKKFSIIVPVYNIESYIGECIESILSQTFKDYELILINDGSTDESLKICKHLAELHQEITIIDKVNDGVSSARNAGIDAAVGEYIIFLDGDDFWNNNKALEAINNIAAKVNPDIITWGFKYLYKKDKQIIFTDTHLFPYDKFYGKKPDFLYPLIRSRCYTIDAWDKAVKRELLLKNELYFKPLIRLEDMEWSVRVTICADSFAWCNIPFQVYRLRPDSTSHKFSHKSMKDAKIAFDISYDLIQKITDNELKNSLLAYIAGMYFTILCDIRCPFNKDKYVKLFKSQSKLLDYVQISEAITLNKWIKRLGFYPIIRIVRFVKRLRLL